MFTMRNVAKLNSVVSIEEIFLVDRDFFPINT